MKKNNSYLADDEIDLGEIIISLWREKILILSTSIICGFLGYLYASFIITKQFKTEVILRNPPAHLFKSYENILDYKKANEIFISNFKLNFFSSDNLESFVEENRGINNFNGYLKLKNIIPEKYFANRLQQDMSYNKSADINYSSKYFLLFSEELDGDIFLNNFVEFIQKKNIFEFKKILKSEIIYKINNQKDNLDILKKLIYSKNPLRLPEYLKNDPEDLENFLYKSDFLLVREINQLSQIIITLEKKLIDLENDQFNYDIFLDKASPPALVNKKIASFFFIGGLIAGLILSLVVLFFKYTFKTKVKNLK